MTDTLEKRNEIVTDLLIDAWDVARLLTEYEAHYQRGFEAGKAASSIGAEQLKAEFERGRESYRDELLATLDAKRGSLTTSLVKEIEEKPTSIKSMSIARPGRGPKPTDITRPPGIPSNYEMCRIVLTEVGKPLSGSEIRDHVANRWWPNVPHDWKSSPFGFLSSGKLIKNADNKFILPDVVVKPTPSPRPALQEVINQEVAKRITAAESKEPPRAAVEPFKPRIPEPGKKLGAPARAAGVMFRHGGETVTLHEREAIVTEKLYAARGKGHVGAKFLADAIGIKSEAELTMQEFVKVLNPKIAPAGLTVEFFKGFGFLMKDIPANG